jgi:ABC-type transport system involved in cytochrome bd biosynthesis fused ATPase/permease subunit
VDGIQGMADLLAYGQADERLTQISANGIEYGNAQRRMARVTGFHSSLSTLLTNLGLWTILLLCIPQVTSGNLAGPMLASLTLLTFASFEAVTPLPLAAQMWNSSREAAKRLFEVVDTKPEVRDEERETSNEEKPLVTHHSLLITDLSFTYPNQTAPALQNITFNLQSGKSIAIVGPSGAGKSTPVYCSASGITKLGKSLSAENRSKRGIKMRYERESDSSPRIPISSIHRSTRICASPAAKSRRKKSNPPQKPRKSTISSWA